MLNCFVPVIFQKFVHFNDLFVIKYQKFVFCSTCVVKMENSLGERAWHNFIKSNNNRMKPRSSQ